MTKEQFIDQFVTTFLATWCAENYTHFCMTDQHESLYNPPIEDAYDMAEGVWENLQKLKPS